MPASNGPRATASTTPKSIATRRRIRCSIGLFDRVKSPVQAKILSSTAAGRKITPAPTSLLTRTNQYDTAGNLIQRQTEDGAYNYAYDKLGRLTKASPPAGSTGSLVNTLPQETYTYDPVNNRTSSQHQPGPWVYNTDNQLLQWGTGSQQTRITYNPNGHTAQQTYAGHTRTHRYNAADRLSEVTDDQNNSASYQYDPQGRRISKTVNGQTTWYLYSDEGLMAEMDAQGNISRAYGWEPDTAWGAAPLWQAEVQGQGAANTLANASYHYLHRDHLGTPQLATNPAGQKSWKGVSEAFGQVTPESGNQITMNLRFPGQYFDNETRLSNNYFRDYEGATGRYIQSDPIGLRGGINTFAYVGGNPLSRIDPRGLKVVFTGNAATQAALQTAYNSVAGTPFGGFLTNLMEASTTVYTVTNQQNGNAYFDPATNTISIDPNFHPPTDVDTGSTCAVQPSPTNVILGHEIGHAITGALDDGPDNMNNVNQNENPIRQQLGLPVRMRY